MSKARSRLPPSFSITVGTTAMGQPNVAAARRRPCRTFAPVVARDTTRVLSLREFFETIPIALAPRLPAELRAFDLRRGPGRLVKLDYGRPEFHFEAWHHNPAGRFEVGLHLEGSKGANDRLYDALRERLIEVKRHLPNAELEPWDRGWCRLYETFPATALSQRTLETAAVRLAAYITTLQPMLEEL